jgi:hypothetical protein
MWLTLFNCAMCWWLGLFLLNRAASLIPFGLVGTVLSLWGFGQAIFAVAQSALAPNTLLISLSILIVIGGLGLAIYDARSRNENAILPLTRSFDAAFLTGILFGIQVALIARVSAMNDVLMFTLLCSVIGSAIFIQTFSARLADFFDRFAFAYLPALSKQRLNQARADLRAAAEALPKAELAIPDFSTLSEDDFIKLTRRALTNFGDLPKLSTSPLIYLPIIEQRLGNPNGAVNTLERTVELKNLLAESILRLKPSDGNFGTSPEWRHFNVLYFPYVRGIKPYTLRINGKVNGSNDELHQALDWFQREVPERTLYNWQNAAAKLVAHDLRTRNNSTSTSK